MKTRIIFFMFALMSFCLLSSAQIYHPLNGIDEAKRYFYDNIMELDQIEGIYEVHLDVNIHNSYQYGGHHYYDYYYIIFNPYRAEKEYANIPFVIGIYNNGSINTYADVYKNGSTYSFQERDVNGRIVTVKFQMVSSNSFSYSRDETNGMSSSTRTTKARKIYPTNSMYQEAIARLEEAIRREAAERAAKEAPSSGTGFFLSRDGYIVTNYHVIEDAKNNNIKVTSINGNTNTFYNAVVAICDKQNDLAILKITDPSFVPLNSIPYTFKFVTSSIGEDCFVLGYPLVSSMGSEIKLTNGIISSKTGYEGNIAQYQISAPVQPGNSGGPLFDSSGNIIGVVKAKHTQAENAGYAIKASYIRNLVELLPEQISFPQTNILTGKKLPQQVELASKAVCLIIVNGNF